MSLTTGTPYPASTVPCTTTLLPAPGVIYFNGDIDPIYWTIDDDAVYEPACTTATPTVTVDTDSPQATDDAILDLSGSDGDDDDSPQFSDFRDPFYASSFPICYALAATTVTAYILVIMLFIAPRSFFDSGVVYLGRRGAFTNSSSGGVSIGGRPWLQKVAALTVAISLTIATADTFRIAQIQYLWGVQNAKVLQNEVMGSTELKVIRIISDTFLWLAQAQTLIRLFPRQREKIIIKWAAFALVTLDVVFSALDSFLYSDDSDTTMPKSFAHPIPALSYLFELSLGVLYAAWVIYYALMKKRYAFYHPLMKNMCLVAVIALTSIVIPVVFFILDISKPQFTGWGDYVRWVGAAAASVVVWEWVERIEALEREEKKNGILGREVFDGDDTMEVNGSELPWVRKRKSRKGGGNGGGSGGGVVIGEQEQQQHHHHGSTTGNIWPGVSVITNRRRDRDRDRAYSHDAGEVGEQQQQQERTMGNILRPPTWLARPAPVTTPVSRTDTASAASTVYAVRYQGGSEGTTRTPDPPIQQENMVDLSRQASIPRSHAPTEDAGASNQAPTTVSQNGHITIHEPRRVPDLEANAAESDDGRWRSLFHQGSSSARQPSEARSTAPSQRVRPNVSRWDVRTRLEEFAARRAETIRERIRPTADTDNLPVTVIPAPPRRGAALQQVLEEEEMNSPAAAAIRYGRRLSNSSDELEDYVQVGGRDGAFSTASHAQTQGGGPIPPTNPPLWPGVNHRRVMYDDDDDDDYSYDEDDESLSERSSVRSHERGRERDPPDTGPDDRRTTAARPPGN